MLKGKRYKDYDDKFMKNIIFKNKKYRQCSCGKKINYKTSYFGFNRLLCKECYIKLDESCEKAVAEMVKRL